MLRKSRQVLLLNHSSTISSTFQSREFNHFLNHILNHFLNFSEPVVRSLFFCAVDNDSADFTAEALVFALVFACLRHVRKRQRSQKRKRRRRSVSPPLHAIASPATCFFRSICSCRSLLHSGWSSVYISSLLSRKFQFFAE